MRNPARLPEHLRNSVEVVQGNVLNYSDVLNAIKNVTAVVVVLGTRNDLSPTTVLSEGTKNIVKAMKELNVEIISVCLSAFLFYSLKNEPEKVPGMFEDLNADHERMYNEIKASGLKYIAVFPPHIAGNYFFYFYHLTRLIVDCFVVDEPLGNYQIIYDANPGRVISKRTLGKFLIDCLTQPEHYGKVCGICNK